MKGPIQFSVCPGYTMTFCYSSLVFSKYVCIVLYIERCKQILIISMKNTNKKGVSGKFTNNTTRPLVGFFVNERQNFHGFLHLVKISTHETIIFFRSWNFPIAFLIAGLQIFGVFVNTSKLIYLSFFRKHPYIWIILPGS